ncbi:MAG: N-carbamoylsarcosine amidase [Hyphomicrobiales bacterium]|nr:N-carbamoylsarcosine amidase [Hyphomicrobiales bacterium]
MSYLILLGCDSVIVTEAPTSGCVRATVIDAFTTISGRPWWRMDASTAQASHAINLCDMNAKYADVLPSSNAKYADVLPSSKVLEFASSLDAGLFPGLHPATKG